MVLYTIVWAEHHVRVYSRQPGQSGYEIQDFDRVVQFWARILRFILAFVRDRDIAETLTRTASGYLPWSKFIGSVRRCHG
jgi:hypothetical protein